jgi:hypothetical protein
VRNFLWEVGILLKNSFLLEWRSSSGDPSVGEARAALLAVKHVAEEGLNNIIFKGNS